MRDNGRPLVGTRATPKTSQVSSKSSGNTDLHRMTNLYKDIGFKDWWVGEAYGPTVARMASSGDLANAAIGLYVSDCVAFFFDSQGRYLGHHAAYRERE